MKKTLLSILAIVTFIAQANWALAVTKEVPATKSQAIYSYAPLVKKVSPAVVNIYTKKKVKVQSGFSPFMNDPIFQNFFANVPGGIVTERIENSLGSGVIVKDNGVIVTNNHVINGSNDIRVVLHDRREFDAKVILADAKTDLALLKIDVGSEKLDYIIPMDSDALEVGDMVIAIGNPFGVGQTVTSGIVSAIARSTIGISNYEFFIQTDAAINPGNSGGALVNMEGQLAGINTAIYSKSGGSQGIGFAIPANMVATILNNKGGKIIRPWLGITTQSITNDIANSLGLKTPKGTLIAALNKAGSAEKAGLKIGDVILAVDNHDIEDENALNFRIATYAVDSNAKFKILRSGKELEFTVKMEAAPELTARDYHKLTGHNLLSGATIANLSPALADDLNIKGIDTGVIVIEIENGNAAALGVQKNDIIKQVNGTNITSATQAKKLLSEEKLTKWSITLQRGNQLLNVMYNGKF